MNWIYKGKIVNSIEDVPNGMYGFIYLITNKTSDRFYIGKKILKNSLNKRLGKKERAMLPITKGRKPTKKKVITESNWQTYWGSSVELSEDVLKLGEDNFSREILFFTKNKKQQSYFEVYYQFKYDVLTSNSYNLNISGHYFKKDLL